MLGRLGDTRLTAESSHAWSVDRLDEGEAGMPEEIDALATSRAGTGVQVLVCGTPTTTSAPSGTARPRAHRPEQTETVRNGALSLRIALPLPSVSLVEITPAA
jgi:hypothetical protein